MKSDKVEMNKGLLEAWLGAVHENDLPVNIQTGKEFDDCKCIDFRNWLKEVHGEVFEISAGEFKESGTSISTMAVVIKK